MESVTKYIQELEQKAVKYDNSKDRYQEWAKKLDDVIKQLQALKIDIDPISGMHEPRKNSNMKMIAEELYNLLVHGTEISRDFIEKAYTEISFQQVAYLMKEIAQMNKVCQRKEGVRVIYFIAKDI
jgi:hypothetical protein